MFVVRLVFLLVLIGSVSTKSIQRKKRNVLILKRKLERSEKMVRKEGEEGGSETLGDRERRR